MAAEICRWEKEIALKSERNHQSTGTAVLTLAAAAVLLAVDQILKYFVVQSLKPVNAVTVIPGLLELVYVENTGAAFGLFKSVMWLVVAVTVVATAAIAVMLFRYKRHSFLSYATSALLISGGIGNLIDRILHGYVIDYIHVLFFDYVFNFAAVQPGRGAQCAGQADKIHYRQIRVYDRADGACPGKYVPQDG